MARASSPTALVQDLPSRNFWVFGALEGFRRDERERRRKERGREGIAQGEEEAGSLGRERTSVKREQEGEQEKLYEKKIPYHCPAVAPAAPKTKTISETELFSGFMRTLIPEVRMACASTFRFPTLRQSKYSFGLANGNSKKKSAHEKA
jgi:hypothetical protein